MKINCRIILSIIISFVVLAYLQDRLDAFSMYMIKLPFVLSAFIYFLFRHRLVYGIIAGVFCALLGDGLSESSGVAYLLTCIFAFFANFYFFKKQLPENSVSCGLIALPMVASVLSIQYLSLLIYVEFVPPFSFFIVKLVITALLTTLVTIVIAELIYRFDKIVGNKEEANEELG